MSRESGEYKIISGTSKVCQKVLNQWRHIYSLRILHMFVDKGETYILLLRTAFTVIEGGDDSITIGKKGGK